MIKLYYINIKMSDSRTTLLSKRSRLHGRAKEQNAMGMTWWCLATLMAILMAAEVRGQGSNSNVTQAQEFLDFYNKQAQIIFSANAELKWTYNTNITDYNSQKSVESQLKTGLWQQNMSRMASKFNTTDFSDDMKRQFYKIKDIGTAAMPDAGKLEQLNKILSEMQTIYSTGKVCFSPNECLPLDPDLTQIFETSRNESQLRKAWVGWRDATGRKMRELYTLFVSLSNEAVQTLNYEDTGAYWRSWYEDPDFEKEVAGLWVELKPLYEQLHAYVRRRLREQYGESLFPTTGHIPAHLLGNMWAQQWNSLLDLLMPFPDKQILDVTKEMVNQNYTALKIFQTADNFFQSLGMIKMPEEFWNKSMLERPSDGREVVCHASAWDFSNGVDFRVKQCTAVTMGHFSTAHHEMGHIEYYLQYKNLPVVYRGGANPGFHEAVGDVISLSVETPKHLHKIGLLPQVTDDNEADINFLMAMALQKIAFLPFGYLIDQWRWGVFRGQITKDDYNQKWWDLRCGLQGVSPPVPRSEDDFDPGAKFHIPGNTPYIRYFISFILQFQFHQSLCNIAGHQGPLHQCDIYNNTAAGEKLSAMLQLGSSKIWKESLFQLTGTRNMNASALMNYFTPLITYLKSINENDVGWTPECPKLDNLVGGPNGVLGFKCTTMLIILISVMSAVLCHM